MKTTMTHNIYARIATAGAIGYHIAPGTLATCCVMPLFYGIAKFNIPFWVYVIFASLTLGAGWYIVKKALPSFTEPDPCYIVLDEMVAVPLVFVGLPANVCTFILGFLFFRFFDICKPLGITLVERLGGAAGIMLDDVVAALYANILLHMLLYVC